MTKADVFSARRNRRLRLTGAAVGGLALIGGAKLVGDLRSAFGGKPSGERLRRLNASPQHPDGKFVNRLSRHDGPILTTLGKWFFGSKDGREPTAPIPIVPRRAADFAEAPADLRAVWLGHSTALIELDGCRFLVDPVWDEYASPGPLFGVKRFFDPPLALDELPPIDAVVLSHDHYDHLGEATIRRLADRVPRFVVPLGVGAHLEAWGVAAERITERDWWEQTEVGGVTLICTPARHFSGRGLLDNGRTLWSGWALIGQQRRVYVSGDSAMFPGFAEIGERLGPFDLTLIEIGGYDAAWADVHMGPEQAAQAHRLVRGKRMLPTHWATFNLAFHPWTEPAERLLVVAQQVGIDVVMPRPGEFVGPGLPDPPARWWPTQPWRTASEAPVVSSGL